MKKTFRKELCHLLNYYSKEGGSDTPDFILAEYLEGCLKVYDKTLKVRELWYNRALNKDVNHDI